MSLRQTARRDDLADFPHQLGPQNQVIRIGQAKRMERTLGRIGHRFAFFLFRLSQSGPDPFDLLTRSRASSPGFLLEGMEDVYDLGKLEQCTHRLAGQQRAAEIAVQQPRRRSTMLEVLRQDYIRTARAKGLPKWLVVVKHALANALIPITTVVGIIVSLLISGSVVTETLFSIPGIGQLLTQAVLNRDYPMVQGGLLITTALLVLVNIGVDVCYALLDPRVRYDGA